MEQHAVLKQGSKEYRRWSDRVLTVDTENGVVFLSEKGKAQNTIHHKLIVQCVQTWPNYKPRYIKESTRSREAMLTIRIRGLAVDAVEGDRVRVSESREGSPNLTPSRVRGSLSDARSPPRTFGVLPASAEAASASTDTTTVQTKNMPSSDSVSSNSPSSPSAASPHSPPASPTKATQEPINCHSEWWMIRVSSLTQLGKVLLSFQHMDPVKYNAHRLMAPAYAGLAQEKSDMF